MVILLIILTGLLLLGVILLGITLIILGKIIKATETIYNELEDANN